MSTESCPFCGSRDVRVRNEGDRAAAQCQDCNAQGPVILGYGSYGEAMRRWNDRVKQEKAA